MSMSLGYSHRKQKENRERELPSCTIPLLLIVYTQQPEILAVALPCPVPPHPLTKRTLRADGKSNNVMTISHKATLA